MTGIQVILFCRGDLHCIDGLKMHIQKQTLWSIIVDGKMSRWSKLWRVSGSLTQWTIRREVIKIFERRPSQLKVSIEVLTSLVNFLKYIFRRGCAVDLRDIKYSHIWGLWWRQQFWRWECCLRLVTMTMAMTITMMYIVALVVSLERAQSTQLVGPDSSLWLRRHLHSTHSYTIGYIGHITESSTIYKWYNHFLSNVLCTSLQDYFNPFSTCTSSSLKP